MGSTRHVEIFQDPQTTDEATMPPRQSYDFHQALFSNPEPREPMTSDGSHGIIFLPPSTRLTGRSPLKSISQPSISPPKAPSSGASASFPPPKVSVFKTDSPIKKIRQDADNYPSFGKQARSNFSSHPQTHFDKENDFPPPVGDHFAEFPEPSYTYSAPPETRFSIIEPSFGIEQEKGNEEEQLPLELPDPASFPPLQDDGKKPQCSYAHLIAMAILRSPERKLTLAQIYSWIADTFSYYRKPKEGGWQNSIRHNLSLNKAFHKQERPKDDPGKGNYWAIVPGHESQFIYKEKGNRRPQSSSGASHKSSSLHLSSEANSFTSQLPLPWKAAARLQLPAKEPSSDATVVASDAPSSADDEIKPMLPPALPQAPTSPLQDIRSSPPLVPEFREDVLSLMGDPGLPTLNPQNSRKRKAVDFDDSGYFSSLDSSATRPYPDPKLPMLDGSLPRMKRGRAEEEIARIRSSSHDISPTKFVKPFAKQPTPSLGSSSPPRSDDVALMPPPLTPAIKFALPPRGPPSISPNTNLQLHRNRVKALVGSPLKNLVNPINGDAFFSPAFKIPDQDQYDHVSNADITFDIFEDDGVFDFPRPRTASPVKRSARRTDRARKSTSVLADITGASINKGYSPFNLKYPAIDSPLKQKSKHSPPHIGFGIDESNKEDIFEIDDFLIDDDFSSEEGLDICAGFPKVGSNRSGPGSNRKATRPALGGRSQTSLF